MPQHFTNQKFMKRQPTAKSFFGNKSDSSMLRSWTRLAVGTILFGLETLVDRTRYWERKVEYPTELENNNSVVHIETKKDPSTDVIEYLEPDYPKGLNTAIGFIFDVQERLVRGTSTLYRIEKLADRVSAPVLRGMRRFVLFRPIYKTFDKLATRGQAEVERWSELGRIEEIHSRDLVKTATTVTLDASIDYLSTNPDVQELVQVQSSSLVNEVIEEVRERAVSVNAVVEGWVRKMLGLVPREDIPGPPLEVRRRASLISIEHKGEG